MLIRSTWIVPGFRKFLWLTEQWANTSLHIKFYQLPDRLNNYLGDLKTK